MPITYDRSICCDLNKTISREWIVTNRLGGYAAGTIAGVLTRMEHGLLVASLPGATTPELLLAKIDEEVVFDQRTYYLGTNEYRDGTLNPSGFAHLETFCLEEGFPVFTYRLGGIDGIVLEKRIWMLQGQNTTYIQYRVLRTNTADSSGYIRSGTTGALSNGYGRYHEYAETTQRTLALTLLPLVAHRPYNTPQYGNQDWHFHIQQHRSEDTIHEVSKDEANYAMPFPKGVAGCTIRAWDGANPYHILAIGHPESQTTFIPTQVWYWNFLRRQDAAAGRPATDDLYLPGVVRATLWPGEEATLTLIVSAEELATQVVRPSQLNLSYQRAVEDQQRLLYTVQQPQRFFGEGGEAAQARRISPLPLTPPATSTIGGEEFLYLLIQAGNRFVTQYTLPQQELPDNHNLFPYHTERFPLILSDYYSLENRTRDTLIALPGLLLTTQRYDEALHILRGFACHFKQGLLPDRFPLPHSPLQDSDYGSVDTTLWYFYALDHYLRVTQHYEFLKEVYHLLFESVDWYLRGTNHSIHVDTTDGLLHTGKALTWMNAHIENVPVTPRHGKAVEVNALWYYALCLMQEWSQTLYRMGYLARIPTHFQEPRALCQENFQRRFWYEGNGHHTGYLYDVVDGSESSQDRKGNDSSLRPNQLFALSLRYPILDAEYRVPVLDAVTKSLVTLYGLRTLAPEDTQYQGQLGEQQKTQLQALHQGSVWSWLLGPYLDALLTLGQHPHIPSFLSTKETFAIHNQPYEGMQLLTPFSEHLSDGLLGMNGGVFDGNAPHASGYYTASAIGTAELIRSYYTLAHTFTKQRMKVSA